MKGGAPMKTVNATTNYVRTVIGIVIRIAMIAVALNWFSLSTLAQEECQPGIVRPSMETTGQFINALKGSSSSVKHGFAKFARHPTQQERKELKSAGIHVLDPYDGTTYLVRVDKRLNMSGVRATNLDTQLLQVKPEDRVAPKIWCGKYEKYVVRPPGGKPLNYVLNTDGTINVTVRFYKDVNESSLKGVLRKYTRKVKKQSDETWVAVLTPSSLRSLAQEDLVQWIDAGPPPFLPENDTTRATINVDAVQNFNATTGQIRGLGGNDVQVGIFDLGIDQTHQDLTPGMIFTTIDIDYHGTHVAGTVGGRGTLSNGTDSWGIANNGAAFQCRGMAPQAQLIETAYGNGTNAATYLGFILNQGMEISNHSYSVSFDGNYDLSNQMRDQIIRGDATSNGIAVPGRLHVYSAGNHGDFPRNGGEQVGYFSLTKQVKNGLIVGNWDVANNRISQTRSSLGPTYDGRIKPDVVAPGTDVKSTGYCANGDYNAVCQNAAGQFVQRQNFYRVLSGTSMAAAAVTGSVALVLQQYATTYTVNLDLQPPFPSTIRGIMIHTAHDVQAGATWFNNEDGAVQPTAGPDYVTGWGLIDAQAAMIIVGNRLLLEDTLSNTCDTKIYRFDVPAGTAEPIRVTLGWDDVAGNPALPDTSPKLVNDLDLILIDPQGQPHYPWLLDQRIVDANGNEIPDDQQQCGTAVMVQRQYMPVANPNFIAQGNPGNVNDNIPAGGVPAAQRGRDHLNNIEVVEAPAIAGTWQVQVIGFNIPQGPQRFSLVGQTFVLVGADLVVESLTHSPANPTTQSQITFTAVVRNIGTDQAAPSTLSFRVGGETPPGRTLAIPSLAPGQTFTVLRQETLSVARNYRNTVIADIYNDVPEINEINNQRIENYTVVAAECSNGTHRTVRCQVSGRPGTRRDVCVSGTWHLGTCIPTTACNTGDERYGTCSLNGRLGYQREVCRNGAWVRSGGCLPNIP